MNSAKIMYLFFPSSVFSSITQKSDSNSPYSAQFIKDEVSIPEDFNGEINTDPNIIAFIFYKHWFFSRFKFA